MDFKISRERQTERGELRQQAALQLAKAPNAKDPVADAALALLTLWVIAEDEIHFGEMVESAMTITEQDHDEILDLALSGEFNAAARWLVA
jgi:uncharacterized protein YciW